MVESNGFSYNLPLAYLLTATFYFIFCLVYMIVRMGSMARAVVATGGGTVGGYSMLVFTAWDHGLQGDRGTKLKQNNLHYRLQVDLEEERLKQKAASLTLGQTVSLYGLRVFLNLVVLGLIGGTFYGIAEATQFSQNEQTTGFRELLLQYLPSIVITTSNFVVPLLCDKIALMEKHSPSTTVILALLMLDQHSYPHRIKISEMKRTNSIKMKSTCSAVVYNCLAMFRTLLRALTMQFLCDPH
ncbi:transmembrane channel-like protein 7 isoform X2 [Myxocyprinus asiaticus]|nr:transmembrane channel-like protein 7 isoform X2 [Myxocyprinus asiaticus]